MQNPIEYYWFCGCSVSELIGNTMTWLATACVFDDPWGLVDEIKLSGIIDAFIEVQPLPSRIQAIGRVTEIKL